MTTRTKLAALSGATLLLSAGAALLSRPRALYADDFCAGGTVLCASGCEAHCNAQGTDCVWVCPSKPPQQE